MKKIFLTYSKGISSRLKYRAIECDWFDDVHSVYNHKVLLKDLILKELSALEYDDILIYANEFSEINLNGYFIFNERIEQLNRCDIIVKSLYNDIDSTVLYIKKTDHSYEFFKNWSGSFSDFKDKDFIKLLKPSLKTLQAPSFNMQIEFRCCDDDIMPSCKMNSYERYAMFVAGHVLPFYEDNYDCYTHFINVGEDELHRCSANSKNNIKEHQDLAELTALYWMWKNLDINDLEYIGFSTYRKPFLKSNEEMFGALHRDGYDCVANRYHSNFSKIHRSELGEQNVKEFEGILKTIMQPNEYKNFIDDYENSRFMYICNSFMMPSDRFNEFCEKVFKIMIHVSERMNGKSGIKDHRPCAGCFAEAVTSFYIKKMFNRIYTSPFLIYPLYKRYAENNLASFNPLAFGSIIEDGKEIFLPYGECPMNNGQHTFNSKNDTVYRVRDVFKAQGFLVK